MGLRTGQVLRVVTAALVLTGTSLMTTSCGGFFVCEGKASCPTTGTGSGAGTADYVYVSNSSASSTSLEAFNASTGSPATLSASPISLGFEANALAITPDNTLMFASSPSNNAIYAYAISSAGALSNPNGTSAVANQSALAMDISPDGKYLFVLTGSTLAYALEEFAIGTNGVLTSEPTYVVPLVNATAAAIKVAPSADFVVIAMGTAGDVIVPLSGDLFNTGNVAASTLTFTVSGLGDYGVTVDAENNIYFARTGTIAVYSATANGVPTAVTNSSSAAATGSGDYSIVISGSYLYVANFADGTISGYTFTTAGVLTALPGSPYKAPTDVNQLVADNTGKYIVAAGAGSAGIEEFAIGTSGALTASSTTAAAGAYGNAPLVMTATH